MVSKYVLFSPLPGEMIKFDDHIFSDGLVQPPTRLPFCSWTLRFCGYFPYQKSWDFVEESRRPNLRQMVCGTSLRFVGPKSRRRKCRGGFGHLSSEATKGADLLIVWMLRMMVTNDFFSTKVKFGMILGERVHPGKNKHATVKNVLISRLLLRFHLGMLPPSDPLETNGSHDIVSWWRLVIAFCRGFLHPEVAAQTSKVLGNAERSLMLHIWIRRSAFIPDSSKLLQIPCEDQCLGPLKVEPQEVWMSVQLYVGKWNTCRKRTATTSPLPSSDTVFEKYFAGLY